MKNNWEKEFIAKEFKKYFGIKLNTPISGRIVLEEEGRMGELKNFDTYIELVLPPLKIQRKDFIKDLEELPQGHTPDGKHHWHSVEDIDKLKEKYD